MSAFFVDAGDPYRVSDDAPGIARLPRRFRPHHVERGRDCLPRVEFVPTGEGGVLVADELHEVRRDRVVCPSLVAVFVELAQQAAQSFAGAELSRS